MSLFLKETTLSEVFLFLSLKNHPSFLKIDHFILKNNLNGVANMYLQMATKTSPFPSLENLDKFMKVILEGYLTLEKYGIVYGDCKIENIVEIDSEYKIIDMNVMHFKKIQKIAFCQTYEDEMHLKCIKNNEELFYNTNKELVWCIGFLLNNILENKKIENNSEYVNFQKNLIISSNTPERWLEFQKKCICQYQDRCSTIKELIKYSPIEIKDFDMDFFQISDYKINYDCKIFDETILAIGIFDDENLIKMAKKLVFSLWDSFSKKIGNNNDETKIDFIIICCFFISEFHIIYSNIIDAIFYPLEIEINSVLFNKIYIFMEIIDYKIPSLFLILKK